MKKKHKLLNSGLTLIELLVAISIFSILSVGLYSSLSTGIIIWKRSKIDIQEKRSIRFLFDQVRKDLQSAISYSSLEFIGTSKDVYFCKIAYDKKAPSQTYLSKIHYLMNSKKDRLYLEKHILSLDEAISTEEQPTENIMKFLDVRSMSIEYSFLEQETKELIWLNHWSEEHTLPLYVRFLWKIKLNDKEETLSQLIHIPSGKLIAPSDEEDEIDFFSEEDLEDEETDEEEE